MGPDVLRDDRRISLTLFFAADPHLAARPLGGRPWGHGVAWGGKRQGPRAAGNNSEGSHAVRGDVGGEETRRWSVHDGDERVEKVTRLASTGGGLGE